MTEFTHSLVLGKFYPPHAGHHHLIRTAVARSARVTVAVLASSVESIPLASRVRWLRAEHAGTPGLVILGDVDDHPMDFHSDPVWELHMGVARAVLARRAILDGDPASAPVDAVFSSEHYGDEMAKRLGARHVLVDRERVAHPVSGTAVRADPRAFWPHLAPATRIGLAARIVVVGAESTGTTTLSRELAAHLGAPWVPEYGRIHTERKLTAAKAFDPAADLDGLVWTVGDFQDVAARQDALIDAAAVEAPVVVCDNDPWAAVVWGHRYLGAPRADIAPDAARPALYLLTDHDGVPFEQDGWRDGEHLRPWMTDLFRAGLAARGVPWLEVTGSPADRLRRATAAVAEAVARHFAFADPLG
ncbi:AAA family ATPase [Actinosynnema sp. NPDC047251]|uniref:Nicotinamide-nucleotide adenylyltransferase n=1 Tax=Saccharothrix espanaensis (strain ATCC 51144 / DSM 44229 / JCM 9112 / NBRC 15066 / NRRL 15764) TaxID=1179773 RepID=K0JWE2_SACES|nr:AAA family ATPase [Saccharothrix espanaensis]CCH29797.1 Nicotinamide-nucleotide adenylyltransferase [Saccharothrix espanaensis DSM 44229]